MDESKQGANSGRKISISSIGIVNRIERRPRNGPTADQNECIHHAALLARVPSPVRFNGYSSLQTLAEVKPKHIPSILEVF